ncbi:DNA-binding response regulator, OmpR family, contains REC and winged-helix (wHTH) domain [Bradyrhizobium shewense]|uniref:DNA-binding response regulator, OmpR family, contains REC and winged-helix (WHTH) domain n=2 Tax=Bradyrhizobium shewense TaxID=1761772 RepID=A0A1C3X268_9BRAD|nr:DNA-binding response regulator, OmpR family, contains REC and winged-helix (wHTH) domain [Bradyrhizobium shewense]
MRRAAREYRNHNNGSREGMSSNSIVAEPGITTTNRPRQVRNRGERLMYIIVDDRESVANSYVGGLVREGVSSIGFSSGEFWDWLQSANESDLAAVDAFLLGDCDARGSLPRAMRKRSSAPIIAMSGQKMLKNTLELFESGVDDVVHVPIHLREILARTAAIARRRVGELPRPCESRIQVFFNGRDPEIAGHALTLPRRELRILEYMVSNHGKWITKTQIFNAVYGIFESTFDESVIESHVSKLRKKLRDRLGFDAIVARRYVGYRLDIPAGETLDVPMQELDEVGIILNRAHAVPAAYPVGN